MNRTSGTARAVLLVISAIALSLLYVGCAGPNATVPAARSTSDPLTVVGSGNLTTRHFALDGFDEIEADRTLRVDISRGDTYGIAVTSDDNAIDNVLVDKAGRSLKLSLKPGSYMNTSFRVAVTLPDLVGVQVAGASSVTLTGFKPKTISFKLNGASQLAGRLEAGDVSISVAESSKANLGGNANSLVLTASSAGEASLGDLVAAAAKVTMKEASTATVNVKGKLDADLRSASNLYYVGNPSLGTISSVESSSVRRR